MAQITTSKKYTLNWLDIGKAAILAGLTASSTLIFQLLEQWITEPSIHFDKAAIMVIVKTTLVVAFSYLIKQFVSPSKIILKGDDVNVAVDQKTDAAN